MAFLSRFLITAGLCLGLQVSLLATVPSASAGETLRVGLDADMSSASAESGEAIRRGMVVAIDEINEAGGLLGKPLELVVADHRGNPARGMDNIENFAAMDGMVAVMGGLHTPVAMAELAAIHRNNLIYLVPWAAGTKVVDNGYTPNNVFRVSVRDAYAGRFLAEEAKRRGFKTIGLLLEQTGWGRSNEAAFKTVGKEIGLTISNVQWFSWGVKDIRLQIEALRNSGAEAILLVANAREGAVAARTVAQLAPQQRLPIISHWGITGGQFTQMVGKDLEAIDLTFLQTYSFLRPPRPERARAFLARYYALFPGDRHEPQDIRSPVGTAHAYDLMHLLARAISKAGSVDPDKLRFALENLGSYEGLIKLYNPPFTATSHDALTQADFSLARFLPSGAIIPVQK